MPDVPASMPTSLPVLDVLDRLAVEIAESARLEGVDSGLIEKFGLVPPAAALTVALGTILHGTTSPFTAAIALIVAGLGTAGICVAGLGTRVMKRREVLGESDARKVRRLAEALRSGK